MVFMVGAEEILSVMVAAGKTLIVMVLDCIHLV